MSFKHSYIVQNSYLYPLGNTPAVCLTQNLPPDGDAMVLLLGCGDIRSILFTSYAGAGIDRILDFTCCDLQAEILARNIIALTLIGDDASATNTKLIWNVYYHIFLDEESHSLLCDHAENVLRYTGSIEQWNEGPYGRLIRFCDSATLRDVVKLWKLYVVKTNQGLEYDNLQEKLNDAWNKSQHFASSQGRDSSLNAIPSVAPLVSESSNASQGHETFWMTGRIMGNNDSLKEHIIANPMFAYLRSNQVLHYGTNPLLDFHLATAFVRLSADSPLGTNLHHDPANLTHNVEQAAFHQFSEWCRAFRNTASACVIRFVHADAVAFCHVLHHHQIHGDNVSAQWYKSSWSFSQLVLDSPDYMSDTPPPMEFNVIDTSNLADHLGSLNIIVAASPLLARKPCSTLRTEVLKPKEGTVQDSVKSLLCGDAATHAMLCGLQPVQYWRNSTATWHASEKMYKDTPKMAASLSRHVVLWKPTDVRGVQFDANDLAKLVFKMYLELFQADGLETSIASLTLSPEMLRLKMAPFNHYTRASLAVLLYRIQQFEMVSWDNFIKRLLNMIMTDDQLEMGSYYYHSMSAHFSMLKLSQFEEDRAFHAPHFEGPNNDPICTWKILPRTVYVTFLVPYQNIERFQDITTGSHGTPIVHALLQSPITSLLHIYPDVQLGFGDISTSGTRFTNEYTVYVHQDEDESEGSNNRPLIVSFLVTTASLFLCGGTNCRVIFGLRPAFANAHRYITEFGIGLKLYQTSVGSSDVFITKFRPNLSGPLHLASNISDVTRIEKPVDLSIRPSFDSMTTKITSLQLHYTINDGNIQTLLQDKATEVTFLMTDPFTMEVKFGDVFIHRHNLAFPLDSNQSEAKIARQSSWVQYTAPVMKTNVLDTRTDSLFVASVGACNEIALEHLHYVNPGVLPIIDTGEKNSHAEWINNTTGTLAQMSTNEYAAFARYLDTKAANKPGRLGMKESVFNMISYVLGLNQFQQLSRFTLMSGPEFVGSIFVHEIRMDVSNQTVFLDAAAVLVHSKNEFEYLITELMHRDIHCVMKIDKDEVPFWRYMLPMFAERCRTWKHKPTCEYISTGKIPLSTSSNECSICSCGLGIFPEDFLKNEAAFGDYRKYAVRVAIPVIYSSPIGNDYVKLPPMASISPPTTQSDSDTPAQASESAEQKRGKCFTCDASHAKNGEALLRCSACKFAQYCSIDCQRADWRKHKQICGSLKDSADSV